MNIYLYAHGGSKNHGCEAIVRSTSSIFHDYKTLLLSYAPHEDIEYGVDNICNLVTSTGVMIEKCSLRFVISYLILKVLNKTEPLDKLYILKQLSLVSEDSIAFSIGGDNYCYNRNKKFAEYRAQVQKKKIKAILWGCSIEPSSLTDKKLRQDLSRYDLITARESITYKALKPINPNTILAPDPAFTLTIEPGNYPEGLSKRPYIGINVSPLIQECESKDGITIENYRALLRYILTETDRDIALISHVVWEHNDDRIPLKQLYDEFSDSGRVYLVEDQNCMQLKDIISHCEFFVGARTHATIAAYSTCVPTLVIGYSVKAKGIAKDLFGTEDGYVLPVQSLAEPDDLTKAFVALYQKRTEIKTHLENIMPGYIAGIVKAKEAVEAL